MADVERLTLSIAEVAAKIRAQQVSPVELTQAALTQADHLQPTWHSFITILYGQALRQAESQEAALARGEFWGPLQATPIGIKDNIAAAGIHTTVGTRRCARRERTH
jgi:Asp-tRNA(Asn)/Glu-tRNA(Gln) amidotransferase A subunit family amidase